MTQFVKLYILVDPKSATVRYIGITKNTLASRLRQHISSRNKDNCHRNKWLRLLDRHGLKPSILLLEVVRFEDWQEREKFWIRSMRQRGLNLVNSTDGGDGLIGLSTEITKEAGRKSGLSRKGKPQSKARNARAAASILLRWQKPGEREAQSKRMRELLSNPEYRSKISEGQKRANKNPATRLKKAEAAKRGWSDPEYRKRHVEGSKAWYARWKKDKNISSSDLEASG